MQSEEEGLKVKQEETGETLQLPDQGGRGPGEASTSLVVPVQNGQGDSLNLSAGFIQVLMLVMDNSIMHQPLNLSLCTTASAVMLNYPELSKQPVPGHRVCSSMCGEECTAYLCKLLR